MFGPAVHQPLDLVGPGVGGEVQVRALAAEKGVAYRAPHQVQAPSGGSEASGQILEGRAGGQQRPQSLRDEDQLSAMVTLRM